MVPTTTNNSSKIVVSKFGGTSMGDAECMLRSAMVSLQRGAFAVVVSATSGTTNQLIEIGKRAEGGDWPFCEGKIAEIEQRHLKIESELKSHLSAGHQNFAGAQLAALFDELRSLAKGISLLKDCSLKAMDSMMSMGERMSSVLFVGAMQAQLDKLKVNKAVRWVDARKVLVTDDQFGKARPVKSASKQKADEILKEIRPGKDIIVTQGFIGGTEQGFTTTLGRGGSDYSAALFAQAFDADELEIWTDVAGIATTDPRLCKEAISISEISFKEASELATFGAKVLHPATLAPAMENDIPVFVGSSFNSEAKGTWIKQSVKSAPLVRALALRKKQVLVTLSTPDMLYSHGFLFQIFSVFNRHKVSIDAITTSEISVALTLDDAGLLTKTLTEELSQFAEVQVEENLSLISLIGNNINHTSGLAKRIFDAIPDVNVRMICLGASRHNFCFLVDDAKGPEVVNRLHQTFQLGKSL